MMATIETQKSHSSCWRSAHHLPLAIMCCVALLAGCAPQSQYLASQRPDVNTWYLIWGEGAKPARTLYFAQEGLNSSLSRSMRASVVGQTGTGENPSSQRVNLEIVYESAKEADTVYKKLLINCDQKQYVEEMSFAIYRNDRTSEAKKSGVQPMTATWQQRLGQFTCGAMEDLTTKNGFMDMGRVPDDKLVEFAWTVPWKDGTRPPYTTTRTKEQVIADAQKMVTKAQKQAKDARKAIDDTYLKGAATPEERLAKDLAKADDRYRAASRRTNTFNPALETWVGATEGQLVESWGRPQRFETDENGDRLLTYLFDHSTVLVNGGNQIVGESYTQRCWITWRVRNGVAKTYGWKGEGYDGWQSCRKMNLNIGQGPHPENLHSLPRE